MKIRLILSFLAISIFLFAQRAADAEQLFNTKQYSKAKTAYELLLKQRPNDALYNFRYARCCYELKDDEVAIKHFQMSGNRYPIRNLYLGELYFNTYRFDESVLAYQTYLATLKPDDKTIPDLQNEIKRSVIAAGLLTKVNDIAIADSVQVNKNDFLRFYKFSSELGTLTQEPLKLTSKKTVDKIKYTTQRQDRVYYSDSIHGQMDIFTSYRLMDSWSDPVSVSNLINTPANENYPFLLLDGVTLYFASDGENSMGGYDIFVTRYMSGNDSFLKPENIGFPFNSPFNDYMMVIDEQHKVGWFATDRYQPSGKVMIYTFVPNELKTIVRSEDKDFIRNVAMLKSYRKTTITRTDSSDLIGEPLQENENQFEFVVNDSVVYSAVSQFKNPDAIKQWNELHKMNLDLKTNKLQLNALRAQFGDSVNTANQDALKKSILDAEKYNMNLENQIHIKTLQIRNSENQFLQINKLRRE